MYNLLANGLAAWERSLNVIARRSMKSPWAYLPFLGPLPGPRHHSDSLTSQGIAPGPGWLHWTLQIASQDRCSQSWVLRDSNLPNWGY